MFLFLLIRRRVRTLYACMAENDGELSFEPNQIITNGEYESLRIQQLDRFQRWEQLDELK